MDTRFNASASAAVVNPMVAAGPALGRRVRRQRSLVRARLHELEDNGDDIVCCTCSTVRDIAEKAGIDVTALRVDRPMARRAVGLELSPHGSTLEPAQGLHEAAAADSEICVDLVGTG